MSITDEIQQLQLRILQLEKQKKEEEESLSKKESIDYNFEIISGVINDKKTAIKKNIYCKSSQLARYNDLLLVKHLEAIYNILKILDNRLNVLEDKYN
jgi:hypothetical protein